MRKIARNIDEAVNHKGHEGTPRKSKPKLIRFLREPLCPLWLAAFLVLLPGSLVAQDSERFAVMDSILQASIENPEVPGAVLLVGHDGQVIYRKAFGNRSLEPTRAPMTVETIFDLASLTKVIATTTAIMQL